MPSRSFPLALFLLAVGPALAGALAPVPVPPEPKPPGLLLLIGGRHQDLRADLRNLFFELAGGQQAKIVVIPTAVAHAEKPEPADEFLQPWLGLKPASVVVLHTRDRKTADDPVFVRPLTQATAVWLTNGHRDRLLLAYRATLVEKELKALHARGGLVGATGSGMAVLGEAVVDRASEDRLTEPGLGVFAGFLLEDGGARERFPAAVAVHPALPGLVIGPDTALLVGGTTAKVLGPGGVTVRLAAGAGKEALHRAAKAGDELDLADLRRAARERAGK